MDFIKCVILLALIMGFCVWRCNGEIESKRECDNGVVSSCIEYNHFFGGNRR